jgi:GR25 family glycosyltransferase involved in LPS biosynthesis
MRFYWINVDKSIHRRQFMRDQFEKLEFETTRIEAYTPNDLKHFEIKKTKDCSSNDLEFACLLSHLKAIKKGYEDNEEYFIVCEDDIFIPEINFEKLFDQIKQFEEKIQDKVEVLQMFTNGHPFIIELYNQSFIKDGQLFKKIGGNNKYSSTGIYLISREGAAKILKKYIINDAQNIYDFTCSHWVASDHLVYIAANSYILTYPFFVTNTNFGSDIHQEHCKNHMIANNVIHQIQGKNNQLDLIISKTNQTQRIQMLLHSGMCNQLFMIFATIAYSIRHGVDFIFYSGNEKTLDNGNPVYFNNMLSQIKYKTTPHFVNDCHFYQEKEFAYNEIPPIQSQMMNVKGFFQSYKYFEKEYDQIMNIIGMNDVREKVLNEFQHVFAKPCISIHFRQGDYLSLQHNHPIAPLKYYQNAIEHIEKCVNINEYNILFFCQSIDNQIVRKMLNEIQKEKEYKFLKVSDNIPDWKQMLLISFCKHHIIANSTFSWWGAYMCENKDKIVCTPMKQWFGPALKNHDIKDLCPSTWVGIDF